MKPWWTLHTFDDYGDYQVNATYVGLDNVTINNATISVSKQDTTPNITIPLYITSGIHLLKSDCQNLK